MNSNLSGVVLNSVHRNVDPPTSVLLRSPFGCSLLASGSEFWLSWCGHMHLGVSAHALITPYDPCPAALRSLLASGHRAPADQVSRGHACSASWGFVYPPETLKCNLDRDLFSNLCLFPPMLQDFVPAPRRYRGGLHGPGAVCLAF